MLQLLYIENHVYSPGIFSYNLIMFKISTRNFLEVAISEII
jgi:hypothetical protein